MICNAGATPIDGTFMFLTADARLLGPTSYSNCRYDDYSMLCEFDTELQPGRTYGLSMPITLKPPANSTAGSRTDATVEWITRTAVTEWSEFSPLDGTLGTSAPVTLEEMQTAQAEPQADARPQNDSTQISLTVTGPAPTDVAAIGARRTAAIGDKVAIKVGLRSLGPGTLHPKLYNNNSVSARVVLPGNVSVVTADPRCNADSDGDQEGSDNAFWCGTSGSLARGKSTTFAFLLAVEQRRGKGGSVTAVDGLPPSSTGRADDVAEIVFTVSGEDLPITGPGLLGPVAAGLALLFAGLLLTMWRVRVIHRVGKWFAAGAGGRPS